MQKRLEKIESALADFQLRLIRVESKLDSTATKADISRLAASFHRSVTEQTWKFITVAIGMSGLFAAFSFGLARLIQ